MDTVLNDYHKIKSIKKQIHFRRLFTPVNLAEQREKFLNNQKNNPQIIYPEFDHKEYEQLRTALVSIPTDYDRDIEGWLAKRLIEELVLQIELILKRETLELTDLSQRLFQCTFDAQYITHAQVDAASPLPFQTLENKTPTEVIEGIRAYLKRYGISDWDLSLTDRSDFYFQVLPTKRKILISKYFNWDFCDFDNMLAHEIDGHVLRAVNAQRQTDPILQQPLPFYIKTEEGLASFLGDYCSTTAEISRKHHALKYLAGQLAQSSSFVEIFNFFCDHGFTPDLAFQRTFRLKRGFSDTSQPGCFAREAMYYEGMLEVKHYLDKGGDIKKLYSAKIGLDDLKFVEVSSKIIVPDRIQLYLAEHTE